MTEWPIVCLYRRQFSVCHNLFDCGTHIDTLPTNVVIRDSSTISSKLCKWIRAFQLFWSKEPFSKKNSRFWWATIFSPLIIITVTFMIRLMPSRGFVHPFLPLDEAVASRAVFVIASGSDGRAERLWSQLNNSKTVRDRPYASMGS